MRVVEPHHFYSHNQTKAINSRKKIIKNVIICFFIFLLLVGSLGVYAYKSPLPKISATSISIESSGQPVKLPWPNYGQSAIGATGYGLLLSNKSDKPAPTASVAKVLTVLAILKVKPMSINEDGPLITLHNEDVQLYSEYVAKNGSVVPVEAGEKITERQALEAILLPSSNNMADSMAIWAFGSIKLYTDYANSFAKELGLNHTTITSASGYPPDTVSTAEDLVKIGLHALQNPIIAKIVSQPSAKIPIAGTIHNVNHLLGQNNVIGIKTGNTDQAGGCYLFAARRVINNRTVTLVGAIMGAKTLYDAIQDSKTLISSGFGNFEQRRIVHKGDRLGFYNLPWGGNVTATADKNIDVFTWKGSQIHSNVKLDDVSAGDKNGTKVGLINTNGQSAQLILTSDIAPPSQSWRLFRWF